MFTKTHVRDRSTDNDLVDRLRRVVRQALCQFNRIRPRIDFDEVVNTACVRYLEGKARADEAGKVIRNLDGYLYRCALNAIRAETRWIDRGHSATILQMTRSDSHSIGK